MAEPKKVAFERTHFTTDRTLEFFTESELRTQIGCGRDLWPLAITKELLDNALDACESAAGDPPHITVTLEPAALTVTDNGPGIPDHVIDRSLDYLIRVSDKKHYVSPTRGQLGNALKCVWAAPFVVGGERGLVEVESYGIRHCIRVELDRLAQKPRIVHDRTEDATVQIGASVKIHWPKLASLESEDDWGDLYRAGTFGEARGQLIADFAAFNPHAAFILKTSDGEVSFPASSLGQPKWRGDAPTSPHWYRPEDLRDLIAAYLTAEKGGPSKFVRDFVEEFAGLARTQTRKTVLEQAGIAGTLRDLVVDGDLPMGRIVALLDAMKRNSRPIKPAKLGIIGEDHIRAVLLARHVAPDSFKYLKAEGTGDDDLPYVIEVAYGIYEKAYRSDGRGLSKGLNCSPVFNVPTSEIREALAGCRIDGHDPVELFIHQTMPRFAFTGHGKGTFE
jgi:DNA topoisomerase VI subunit B